MEWDESLFALPSPALSGSGTVGIISALNYLGTPLRKCRGKVKKEILNWQRFMRPYSIILYRFDGYNTIYILL